MEDEPVAEADAPAELEPAEPEPTEAEPAEQDAGEQEYVPMSEWIEDFDSRSRSRSA